MPFRSNKSDGDSASRSKNNKQPSSSQAGPLSRSDSRAAAKSGTVSTKRDTKKIAKKQESIKRQTGKDLEKCLKPGKQAHEMEKQHEKEARIADELYEANWAGFRSAPNPGTRMTNGKVVSLHVLIWWS